MMVWLLSLKSLKTFLTSFWGCRCLEGGRKDCSSSWDLVRRLTQCVIVLLCSEYHVGVVDIHSSIHYPIQGHRAQVFSNSKCKCSKFWCTFCCISVVFQGLTEWKRCQGCWKMFEAQKKEVGGNKAPLYISWSVFLSSQMKTFGSSYSWRPSDSGNVPAVVD